jgi:hypothetical protein
VPDWTQVTIDCGSCGSVLCVDRPRRGVSGPLLGERHNRSADNRNGRSSIVPVRSASFDIACDNRADHIISCVLFLVPRRLSAPITFVLFVFTWFTFARHSRTGTIGLGRLGQTNQSRHCLFRDRLSFVMMMTVVCVLRRVRWTRSERD